MGQLDKDRPDKLADDGVMKWCSEHGCTPEELSVVFPPAPDPDTLPLFGGIPANK